MSVANRRRVGRPGADGDRGTHAQPSSLVGCPTCSDWCHVDAEAIEAEIDPTLRKYWKSLGPAERAKLLQVPKKKFFERIRNLYCSRCYGLFLLRYDELRTSADLECPACAEVYAGLEVSEDGGLELAGPRREDPFTAIAMSRLREQQRELQFMSDICGSGWRKRPHLTMCSLHTAPVPAETLSEYWHSLPREHRAALLSMREEDFLAELDGHMRYHLKICRDCRLNVARCFKDLRMPGAPGEGVGPEVGAWPTEHAGGAHGGDAAEGASNGEHAHAHGHAHAHVHECECGHHHAHTHGPLPLVSDLSVAVQGQVVRVLGPSVSALFERAEELEDMKAQDPAYADDGGGQEGIRHAETPELAREVLQESAVMIFKTQVEVAFREQTAGHNALVLFAYLALHMMLENIECSYRDGMARAAQDALLAELLGEEEQAKAKKAKKKARKKAKRGKQQRGDGEGAGEEGAGEGEGAREGGGAAEGEGAAVVAEAAAAAVGVGKRAMPVEGVDSGWEEEEGLEEDDGLEVLINAHRGKAAGESAPAAGESGRKGASGHGDRSHHSEGASGGKSVATVRVQVVRPGKEGAAGAASAEAVVRSAAPAASAWGAPPGGRLGPPRRASAAASTPRRSRRSPSRRARGRRSCLSAWCRRRRPPRARRR
ncbi:unnamed protein product [Pedinophyceae sp. YPF-701]|nr:unnamed protein product [Pedinophyceae sp. YPF-701]